VLPSEHTTLPGQRLARPAADTPSNRQNARPTRQGDLQSAGITADADAPDPGRVDCACPRVRHIHGQPATYVHCGRGCRCHRCRLGAKRYHELRKLRIREGRWTPWVSAAGLARRLQALFTNGWSPRLIGERCGLAESHVRGLMHRPPELLRANSTAFSVIPAVYDQLWDQQPPRSTPGERQGVSKCQAEARRRGYAPALAWDDDTIDDPAAQPGHGLRGHQVGRPRDEARVAEIARLTDAGLSPMIIAARVGTSTRTVLRERARRRAAA
jgi:hypothetical protein